MNDDLTLGMSVPLDSDGFLRRECPTCEREFKWLPSLDQDEGPERVPDGGYFCPYCGVQAPTNVWLTQAQQSLAQNMVSTEILGPMLKRFAENVEGLGQKSGGIISASVDYDEPDKIDPLTELDDMKRIDFVCHPSEPLKVLDDWTKQVHCLICGELNT